MLQLPPHVLQMPSPLLQVPALLVPSHPSEAMVEVLLRLPSPLRPWQLRHEIAAAISGGVQGAMPPPPPLPTFSPHTWVNR